MLDQNLAIAQPLFQEKVPRIALCRSKGLTLLYLLIGLSLIALLSQLPNINNDGKQPEVTMAWQQVHPVRTQRFADQAYVRQLMQPATFRQFPQQARVNKFQPGVAALPNKAGSSGAIASDSTSASSQLVHRRGMLGMLGVGLTGLLSPPQAHAEGNPRKKVVVVGGDGFIGSRVCQQVLAINPDAKVMAISRTSAVPPAWAQAVNWANPSNAWAQQVEWVAADALTDDYGPLLSGADAVISCIGSFGSEQDEKINGEANVRVVNAAAKANVARFVYISVHPDVEKVASAAGLLPDYFKGKAEAEAAMREKYGNGNTSLTIIRPTFVYGGDDIGISPPRVPYAIGAWVDSFMSVPALPWGRAVAAVAPVDVTETARCAALAALDLGGSGDITGHDEILGVSFSRALNKYKDALRAEKPPVANQANPTIAKNDKRRDTQLPAVWSNKQLPSLPSLPSPSLPALPSLPSLPSLPER